MPRRQERQRLKFYCRTRTNSESQLFTPFRFVHCFLPAPALVQAKRGEDERRLRKEEGRTCPRAAGSHSPNVRRAWPRLPPFNPQRTPPLLSQPRRPAVREGTENMWQSQGSKPGAGGGRQMPGEWWRKQTWGEGHAPRLRRVSVPTLTPALGLRPP